MLLGIGWGIKEKGCVKGLSDRAKDSNYHSRLDLSQKSIQKTKQQLENVSARIVTEHHKYFADLSDIQMTTMVSIDFEVLPIKFRLVGTPGYTLSGTVHGCQLGIHSVIAEAMCAASYRCNKIVLW
jgi:hypothetical protein